MCNINIAFRNDLKSEDKLADFMNKVSWDSFQSNSDGEGYLKINGKGISLLKSKNKLKYGGKSAFIASHQRLTTSGYSHKNIHPYESAHFVLEHNGVISGLGDKDKSDSSYFLDMIEAEYDGEDVVKAIQKASAKVTGRFSIMLYDKDKKKAFYFKESGTSMYMLKGNKYTVMSTKKPNVEYGKWYFGLSAEVKEVKPNIIYDLFDGFKEIGTFSKKEITYDRGIRTYGRTSYSKNETISKYVDDWKEEDEGALITREQVTKINYGNEVSDKRMKIPVTYSKYEGGEGEIYMCPEPVGEQFVKGDWRKLIDLNGGREWRKFI